MQHLIVVRPFGAYAVAQSLPDPAALEPVRAGEHAGHVVRINPSQEI